MMQMAEDTCARNIIEKSKTWVRFVHHSSTLFLSHSYALHFWLNSFLQTITEDAGYDYVVFQCRYYVEAEDWEGASRLALYPIGKQAKEE